MIDAAKITQRALELIEALNKPLTDFLEKHLSKKIDLVENKEAAVESHTALAIALLFHAELTLGKLQPAQRSAVQHEANRLLTDFRRHPPPSSPPPNGSG